MNTTGLYFEFELFKANHPICKFERNGTEGEYISCGSGSSTILLFHGFAGNVESVYKFILAFENEYRIICPAISALQPASVSTALDYIQTILERENLRPDILIGGSFGGLLAQAYWFANRETVKKVILFDTSPPDKISGKKNRKAARIIKCLPWILFKPLLAIKLRNLFRINRDMDPDTKRRVQFSKEIFEKRFQSVSRKLLLTHGDMAFDFMIHTAAPQMTQQDAGLLIILSADDPALKEAGILHTRTYPFAEIVSFTGGGHIGAIVFFDKYIAAIRNMMRDQYD